MHWLVAVSLWTFIFRNGIVVLGVVDTTYYDLLQVSTTASQQEIRQAYKKLAVKLHPDKNREKSMQGQFVKLSEAYDILKDPEKRQQYNLHGAHPTYARRYDTQSQSEYNNLFYNGLYANDEFVDNLSGDTYYAYLSEGFHFINFYSPFCPPCQSLADHWRKLAENFQGLVKVGAVNCKYQNSFCYNVMRISSYPTLLFYENGKTQHFVLFRGDRNYNSLEKFIMSYIEKDLELLTDVMVSTNEQPTAYIIGDSWLHKYSIARIALHLKGLVKFVKIYKKDLAKKLTSNEYTTVVLQVDGQYHNILSTAEAEIIRAITRAFPSLQSITADRLVSIRQNLRSDANAKPWVIYFSGGDKKDRFLAHKLRNKFPAIEFGEINCDQWVQLCLSLQVEEFPAWAIMKVGGTYERMYGKNDFQHISQFIERAKDTDNLQTLSASEFNRIIEGGGGVWILAVIPHKISWDNLAESFTKASYHFKNIQFGVMMCRRSSAKLCNTIALNNPKIIIQNGTRRHTFRGLQDEHNLIEFIGNVMDNSGIELTESKFHEILDSRSAEHAWVIAFFPEYCTESCDQLKYEWKIVARKLKPIKNVMVGLLTCDTTNKRFCDQSNIFSPIIRVYPQASSESYVAHMQNMDRAAYMLEWILGEVDNVVQRLSRPTFIKTVLAPKPDLPLSDQSNIPWLVYFHSPRCYRCYDLYTDFFIAGMMLKHGVKLGKVNCLQEQDICSHERITSYPSIKLYTKNTFSDGGTRAVEFVPQHFEALAHHVRQHLIDVTQFLVENIERISLERSSSHFQHDEF